MSALSTPGGGGNTAQSKPTSGKQKYQKLDINSLYCANRNENSEPSSVKSQLSRKHGMQSLGKVPSARRPPANLPSLKTETGQDPSANSVTSVSTTVTTPPTCTSQTTTISSVGAGAGTASAGGWVSLPPPSSPHFRTEFPSLEAAAQPSHRSTEHSASQLQLRPQTEGSWTCGGAGAAGNGGAPAAQPQPTPAYRAIVPSFLMKGSPGSGLGMGSLNTLRDNRSNASSGGNNSGPRTNTRPAATPRAVEVITARPILRDEQISSLDDISRDAGWAQHDDIDYDQKLDFSDGESTPAPKTISKNNNRPSIEVERIDSKIQDPDEEQLWAERRQKQSNEVAQAVARARQRKEEEQRRQMRDVSTQKDYRGRPDRNRNDRELDNREKDRLDRDKEQRDKDKERLDNRDRDRVDNRDRDRVDNRDRDRVDNNRYERDRDREGPVERRNERERTIEKEREPRDRNDNRDRNENKDRNDNRDRFDRERDRNERNDRDREFRDRDNRDYNRERDQSNPAFSKTFQANIPPRFLRQQQNRQQDDQKGWAFTGKSAPRRQEQPGYNAPRHTPNNGRRSFSRDYSDREDEVRRDKDVSSGPQWRSEMQDQERNSRDFDRSTSKEHNDQKDRRNDLERKPYDGVSESSRTAAEKLSEVFERKSIGLFEPFASSDTPVQTKAPERRITPPSHGASRESSEKDFGKTSWAEVAKEDTIANTSKVPIDKNVTVLKETEKVSRPSSFVENKDIQPLTVPAQMPQQNVSAHKVEPDVTQNLVHNYPSNTSYNLNYVPSNQNIPSNIQNHNSSVNNPLQPSFTETQLFPKSIPALKTDILPNVPQVQQSVNEHISQNNVKPSLNLQKPETEHESEPKSVAADQGNLNNTKIIDPIFADVQGEPLIRITDDKKNERFSNESLNKIPHKEPVERKSSGSGSEKKGRGFGSGGYNVYNRGWGSREPRGRRSNRSSRSNNRASESDGSTDAERKDRRRAPRSPRGPKKQDRVEDIANAAPDPSQISCVNDVIENREPFAPRGQPSRRGRGGFQGTSRPPAPAKRVTGYGPPNTKSPFSQANRVKDNEDIKDGVQDDRGQSKRTGPSKGRDRRPKGSGPHSGEDENWETTSEHSESGGPRRSLGSRQSGLSQRGNRNQNSSNRQGGRNVQGAKKEVLPDKGVDVTEAMSDLKISKNDEVIDDGFQEVRNKKNSKDSRGASANAKEENQNASKQPRSRSNQGGGRNGSSTRNSNEKPNPRGSVPVSGKPNSQYDRPRTANLAPRFVKQRQKQQMGLASSFLPDTGAAPPPPAVNAWDKPISQTLRGNIEEPVEVEKSSHSSQRSSPGDAPVEAKPSPPTVITEKTGVLDGSTPPVETIIFENTNYKTPPAEALKSKYQPSVSTVKSQEEVASEMESRALQFNGDVRARPRSIQEIMAESGRPVTEAEGSLSLPMSFDASQKAEDSSDMKLDFAFDSDLGQLTEDKATKSLGLPRGVHMSTSNTISPLAADLNLKIASVKKVWEMPAVVEGSEELQFAGFEENNADTGAPPNVCKVKPTQQLQSPPPQHYNHVGYPGSYGGLSVPSPPAVLFNSSQQILGSSQQLPQQGGLYGAFLDQTRGQFGGFPATPYGAGSATPYNYQPPPDMFQSLQSQYRMAAAGGGAAFGQSGQLGNSPSTVLISSSSNSLMSATVKPSSQQIGAIGSKGGGVSGVGGVGGVNTFQQQYLGYSGPVGEAPYSLQGLLPRPAPPANSYYSPYQPPAAPAPTYPLQFTQPAQSNAFSSQFLSSQLHVAAAVQQMQQQYRGPMQQQYPPQARPPPQQLKSPLHEHANGFASLCEAGSPTPKGAKPKPPHSPPHKYHAPPPQHPPPSHTPHQHHHQQHQQHQQHPQQHQHQQQLGNGNGRGCGNNAMRTMPQRYPAPIQRPHAAMPLYRQQPPRHHAPRHNLYYHHQPRNGNGGGDQQARSGGNTPSATEESVEAPPPVDAPAPQPAEVKAD
ncbi:protein PRRC2B-like isoform X1 [Pieris napi]|uniref:protein PRRC2B-like isoform X1 n=1 Tax=Pieris napi TaxID=78633 RepID=UPI001FB8CE04|nr:protein PRRC2B-like isoform X1 [Pieris napi]